MDFKKIFEKYQDLLNKKNLYNLVILFLVGVLILIVGKFFTTDNTVKTVMANQEVESTVLEVKKDLYTYEQQKKNELKDMLLKIDGVGRVDVMIYFESGEELVPAVNINDVNSTTVEKDVQGGERNINQVNKGSQVVIASRGSSNEPLILKKNNPKIAGVMIVAEGAEDKVVQYNIIKAVSTLFDIPISKVNVLSMKK